MKENTSISVKEYKRKSLPSRGLMTISVIAGIIPIFIIMRMINLLSSKAITGNQILIFGATICLCQVIKAVFYALSIWKAHDFAYSSLAKIRLDMIGHLKKLSIGFFQKRKIGDLTNIINHDVDQTELYLAHGLPEITIATLIPSITAITLLVIDWRLGLALISTVPLAFIYQIILNKLIANKFEHYVKSTKKMSEDLLEYIATIPIIKAFSKEEKRTQKVLDGMNDYISWVKKLTVDIAFPTTFAIMLMEGGLVVLAIVGSVLLSNQQIDVNTFVLAIILGGIFGSTFTKFSSFHHFGIIFKNAVDSINSVMSVKPINENYRFINLKAGDIEFKDIDFSYNQEKNVLENVNLVFQKNSMNAIVGASGSGKTTIANLLMGFWKPDSGFITIDGKNINKMSEKDLSDLVSIVQQETFLFNMSIEDNIKIGKKNASKEEVIKVAKKARIHNVIMNLPKGYKTIVGESGSKLSGGEKQRISIARMMLKNAPIIILDEATSAIDSSNEYLIKKAIDDLGKNKTIITIAHRLNTILNADQIVVMQNGKIHAKGTHEELLRDNKLYKIMIEEQANVDNWEIKEVVS
ncbi:ABC transporter ATP-binding protein [Vallitalea sediminicola]